MDLKDAGVGAGIDVVRAQVQLQRRRQELIVVENEFEKLKLRLARAIGLPVGQAVTLADKVPYAPAPALALDDALARAYASRSDYQAAAARVEAAEAAFRAAGSERLPTLDLIGNYGTIGSSVGTAHPTFMVGANMSVPVFEGGRLGARKVETDARLQARQSELADYRARVDYDVRAALLDLRAADERVQVAQSTVALTGQELEQARDRFAAGVAGNVEVVQAQEAVAVASAQYIASLYAHNLAKIATAAALGLEEASVIAFFESTIP
jgi:outer membrane protein TolC